MAVPTHVPVWKNTLAGSIAGLAGAFVMNQFQALWSAASKAGSQPQPEGAPPQQSDHELEDDATAKTAQAISEATTGHSLTKQEMKWAGPSVHYGTGATFGAIYGLLASTVPSMTSGRGLVYGSAVWLVADEIGVPAAGLSGPPTETPASGHANALASHLVYGLTTDLVRRLLI